MIDIKFTDAAKFYKGEKHQVAAFEYLQKNTSKEVQEEFQKIYRTKQDNKSKPSLPKEGVELIKEFEGCVLHAYYDPLSGGLPITIGWGTTRRKDGSRFMIGNKITQKEADDLLNYELENIYFSKLQETIPFWNEMNDEMRGALLSFSHNLGANFYGSPDFNTITRHLRNKLWKNVPDAFLLYVNPGTNVETGLKRRRIAEGKLWQKGLDKL